MADFALYWPCFRTDTDEGTVPITGWYTNRSWLVDRLFRGDRLWLFVGGDACNDQERPGHAYLAQLLDFDRWERNADFEPGVRGSPEFHLIGDEARCVLVDPPLPIDDIVRQRPDDDRPIGLLRQTPFELDWMQVTTLIKRLQAERPGVDAAAMRKPTGGR